MCTLKILTLAPQVNAPRPEHAWALVRRHRQFGTLLGQAVERFRAGLRAGRTPARITIERSLNQLDGYLMRRPRDRPVRHLPRPCRVE